MRKAVLGELYDAGTGTEDQSNEPGPEEMSTLWEKMNRIPNPICELPFGSTDTIKEMFDS